MGGDERSNSKEKLVDPQLHRSSTSVEEDEIRRRREGKGRRR